MSSNHYLPNTYYTADILIGDNRKETDTCICLHGVYILEEETRQKQKKMQYNRLYLDVKHNGEK